VLSARPYAFLDDAPLEERRTQAVMARRWLDPETAADLGRLDAEAIERVRAESWPDPANADELHDALVWLGFLTEAEVAAVPPWAGWLAELAQQRRAARLEAPGASLWVTAERLPQVRALWPEAPLRPAIVAPAALTGQDWAPETALVELVRGRLEGEGPVTQAALAGALGLGALQIAGALAALEAEGFAMRGRFTPGAVEDEWCERRLLARIHRYTVKRLRAEIEPVAARDLLRFLFDWQRVAPEARMEGPDAVGEVVAQLEGFEAPAGAWETEILPARLAGYDPAWLDAQCLAGRVTWARLRPRSGNGNGERKVAPVRSTPITLLERRHAGLWASLQAAAEPAPLTAPGQAVADFLRDHGASFFEELADGARLLRTQVEDALAELVASGLVTSDSFGGLRALLVPAERRQRAQGRGRRKPSPYGMEGAGRWALARRAPLQPAPGGSGRNGQRPGSEAVEHIARTLLKRYGVVFWRLLEREASWLPPWRELLYVYRRLEARGEIRGGRFVAGFTGEQFALPEAIGALREARRKGDTGTLVSLSGADPLNLAGILTPGPRLAGLTRNRVLYRDGIPVALLEGGAVRFLETLEPAGEWEARTLLLRSAVPAGLVHLS
jgi:ATP-dependent Lhr-like helicase